MLSHIKEGNHILYIWDSTKTATALEENVNKIKTLRNVQVNVENLERLNLGKFCYFFGLISYLQRHK